VAIDKPDDSKTPAWRESLAGGVAVCALLLFLVLVILMFAQRGTSDTAWSRLVYLLTGVEAVAFAGAGWIFGKEVHRVEAQRAEEQVQTEQNRANEAENGARQADENAQAERLRGARIVQAIQTADAQQPQPVRQGGEREVSARGGSANALGSVADLARRLYPELYAEG
jgi:hypothetical protein